MGGVFGIKDKKLLWLTSLQSFGPFCLLSKFWFLLLVDINNLPAKNQKREDQFEQKQFRDFLFMEMAHEQAWPWSRSERKRGLPKNWETHDETYLNIDDSHKLRKTLAPKNIRDSINSKYSHQNNSFQQGEHLLTIKIPNLSHKIRGKLSIQSDWKEKYL